MVVCIHLVVGCDRMSHKCYSMMLVGVVYFHSCCKHVHVNNHSFSALKEVSNRCVLYNNNNNNYFDTHHTRCTCRNNVKLTSTVAIILRMAKTTPVFVSYSGLYEECDVEHINCVWQVSLA